MANPYLSMKDEQLNEETMNERFLSKMNKQRDFQQFLLTEFASNLLHASREMADIDSVDETNAGMSSPLDSPNTSKIPGTTSIVDSLKKFVNMEDSPAARLNQAVFFNKNSDSDIIEPLDELDQLRNQLQVGNLRDIFNKKCSDDLGQEPGLPIEMSKFLEVNIRENDTGRNKSEDDSISLPCEDDLDCSIDRGNNSQEDLDDMDLIPDDQIDTDIRVDKNPDANIFKCDSCGYLTDDKEDYNQHMQNHLEDKKYACDQCVFRTNNKRRFEIHVLNHTDIRKYVCTECEYKTNDPTHFKTHQENHTGIMKYSCDQCDYKSNLRSSVIRHVKIIHTAEKVLACNLCDYRTNNQYYLTRHRRCHLSFKLFSCEQCSYKTNDKRSLKEHILNHSNVKLFSCPSCSYKTNVRTHFRRHVQSHSKLKTKVLICDTCDYETSCRQILTAHIITKHTDSEPLACLECDYKTCIRNRMRTHKTMHTGKTIFHCDICCYNTHKNSNLLKHTLSHFELNLSAQLVEVTKEKLKQELLKDANAKDSKESSKDDSADDSIMDDSNLDDSVEDSSTTGNNSSTVNDSTFDNSSSHNESTADDTAIEESSASPNSILKNILQNKSAASDLGVIKSETNDVSSDDDN